MRIEDPVDLDGDDEFDAFDLKVIESNYHEPKERVCCGLVFLLPLVSLFTFVLVIRLLE